MLAEKVINLLEVGTGGEKIKGGELIRGDSFKHSFRYWLAVARATEYSNFYFLGLVKKSRLLNPFVIFYILLLNTVILSCLEN